MASEYGPVHPTMLRVPSEVLLEAKRRASFLASNGKLLSPRDAWLLSGQTSDAQTLWSVAFQLGGETDTSAEEINRYLEQQFPQYTNSEGQVYHWDDFRE